MGVPKPNPEGCRCHVVDETENSSMFLKSLKVAAITVWCYMEVMRKINMVQAFKLNVHIVIMWSETANRENK